MIEKIKLKENETVRDNDLPESVSWESVVERPQSVMDLSPTDGIKLESIDSDGHFINDIINDNLNTQTARILGEFQFQASGALAMKTDSNNGLWLSPTGILAKDGGTTTFAIDTGGNATFRGSVTASTITGGTIEGTTITGGTIRTDSSGQRVQMLESTNTLQILDSGGTVRAESYTNGWQFKNSGGSVAGQIFVDPTLGYMALRGVNNDLLVQASNDITFAPGNGSITAYIDGTTKNVYVTSGDLLVTNGISCDDMTVGDELVVSDGITLGGVRRTTWPSTSSGANTSLSNLSGVAVNTTINMNGQNITNCGYLEMDGEIDMGSYDINCTAAIQLAGGGYIDDARAIYFETGRTNNPNISGEMRYYDGASKGFRCNVNGTLYQFSLFEP